MSENINPEDSARIEGLISLLERTAQGDFLARYNQTDKNDQIEAIGIGINMLIEEISSKVSELKKFNDLFVDREIAMVHLKEKIKALEAAAK